MSNQSAQHSSICPYIQQRLTVTRTKDFLQLVKKRPKAIGIDYDQTIVDDDHFNVQITQEILTKAGYLTIAAYNGQEAVEKYSQYSCKISLILMDCEMRIMDGFKATQKILSYANEKKLTPPMIYGLTGHVGKTYEEKCIEAGMKRMIKKPIGYNELLALVSHN